jgi:hypothetical protein
MEYLEARLIVHKDPLQVLDLIRTQDRLQEQDLQQGLIAVLLDLVELNQDLLQDLAEVKQGHLLDHQDQRLDQALHLEGVLIADRLLLLEVADQDLLQVQAEAEGVEDNPTQFI